MEQMEQALDNLMQEPALNEGLEASEKLGDMLNELQDLMAGLSNEEGERLAKEIRKAIDDTNYLSEKQEGVYGACESNNYMVPSIGEAAAMTCARLLQAVFVRAGPASDASRMRCRYAPREDSLRSMMRAVTRSMVGCMAQGAQ